MVRRLSDLHCILSCSQCCSSGASSCPGFRFMFLGSSPPVLSYFWAPIICSVPLAEVRGTTLVSSCSPGHSRADSLGLEGAHLCPLQQLTSLLQCRACQYYHRKQKKGLFSFRLVKTICGFGFWHTRTKEYKDNHYQYINFESFHLSVSKTAAVNANKISLLDIIDQVDSFCKKIHERMWKPLQMIINKRMYILSIYLCFYSSLMHCLLHVAQCKNCNARPVFDMLYYKLL